jgi:hypothetical protein
MYLARLPAGDDTPQIYEVEQPPALLRDERFYVPRAWAYRTAASAGVAALDVSPIRAVKRLSTHLRLDNERRSLERQPLLSGRSPIQTGVNAS